MKYLILLLISISVLAQNCPDIENDIERLSCFDVKYQTHESQPIDEIILKARKHITESFKNPFDVKFRKEKIYNNVNLEKGTTAVCGEVNGKNSYGGYVGFKKYYYTDNGASIYTNKNMFFKSHWKNICKNNQVKEYTILEQVLDDSNSETIGSWTVSNVVDPMMESTGWAAYNFSGDKNNALILYCQESNPTISMYLHPLIGYINKYQSVYEGTSKDKNNLAFWTFLTDHIIYKKESNKKVSKFIKKIIKSNSFFFETGYVSTGKVTEYFNLSGSNIIIEKLKKECKGKL